MWSALWAFGGAAGAAKRFETLENDVKSMENSGETCRSHKVRNTWYFGDYSTCIIKWIQRALLCYITRLPLSSKHFSRTTTSHKRNKSGFYFYLFLSKYTHNTHKLTPASFFNSAGERQRASASERQRASASFLKAAPATFDLKPFYYTIVSWLCTHRLLHTKKVCGMCVKWNGNGRET